jgi:hypothetical protein
VEIYLIDNKSTDGTADLQALAARDALLFAATPL